MVEVLISVIIICVVAGLIVWLVNMLPLPSPFPQIIQVCVVLIALLYLLSLVFGGSYHLPNLIK